MHCSSSDSSSTVYNLFLEAARRYGLPSRVRSDQVKTERLFAIWFTIEEVSNEAWLWAVQSTISESNAYGEICNNAQHNYFNRLFYYMEYHGLLDAVDEMNLYALHYMFLPWINRALDHFHEGWNNHCVRTQHSQTPIQLFTEGALRLQRTNSTALDFFDNVDWDYGIDEEGLAAEDSAGEGITIPPTTLHMSQQHLNDLQQRVNPLSDSNEHGVDLYIQTLNFLRQIWNPRLLCFYCRYCGCTGTVLLY